MQDKNNTSKQDRKNVFKALHFAWTMAYIIVIPIIVFALGGRFLDKHFNLSPLFILIGVFLAMIISMIWIYKKVVPILNTPGKTPKDKTK